MNNAKILLTSEQKKINAKESKRKYYLKNKDKYKKWNAESGFKNVIDNTNDEKILIEYLLLINQKLKQIHSTTSYSN
mgnify:CR=1 FL=1|tara:strand:+ start:1986 stop:2216 length:231 start_codon:yes stop_codon:yes gene_type:complete